MIRWLESGQGDEIQSVVLVMGVEYRTRGISLGIQETDWMPDSKEITGTQETGSELGRSCKEHKE